MKKIFGLLACLFLLMGCDDGEMTFDTFNFTATTPQVCDESANTYVFINSTSKEVLVVTFPSNTFLNIERETDPFNVTGIEYRVYEGGALSNSSAICGGIDNSNLTVKERWTGSGTIDVVTTRVETTSGVEYRHSITLVNVSFNKDGETIRILDNYLGELTTEPGYDFDFAENDDVLRFFSSCSGGRYATTQGREGLIVNLGTTTLPTTAGNTSLQLNTTDNAIPAIYVEFLRYSSSSINETILCQGNVLTPTLEQKWSTVNDGNLIIRTIEVEDTSPVQYVHLLYLADAVFYNSLDNGESFSPAPNVTDGAYSGMYYIGRINP